MDDRDKTKAQLIAELQALRAEVVALKQRELLLSSTSLAGTTTSPVHPFLHLADSSKATRQCTILVLDDSEPDRMMYRRFLTRGSYPTCQIVEFDSGGEALAWCQEIVPDIFLIDYFLPDMNGLEFVQQLRQQTGHAALPVIVITGLGNTEIAVDLLKNGVQDYLDKNNLTPEKLHRAITHVLQQHQLRQQQQWHQERQQLVARTALSIRQSLKLEEILNSTVTEVRQLLKCDRVIIYQFSFPNREGLVVTESIADPAFSILGWTIRDNCFGEKYIEPYRQGRISIIADIETATNLQECYREFLAQFQVRANLVVPIIEGEELWGLLIAHHCTAPRHWTSAEVELMSQLAIQAAIAIQQGALVEKLQTELAERQQAQIALQESEEKFRQLAENIQEVFFLHSAGYGELLYANPAYETIWQQSITDLSHHPIAFLGRVHPEDRDRIFTAFRHLLEGEQDFREEYRLIRRDGSIRWLYVRTFSVYNEAGEPYRVASLASDITERKQAEQKLQQLNAELEQRIAMRTRELAQTNEHLQQELLRRETLERELSEREKLLDGFFNAASNAQVGLCIVDRELRYLKINQALADANGYSIAAHLGQRVPAVLPDIADLIEPLLQRVIDTGETISNYEVSAILPSQLGELQHWLLSYFPILVETGQVVAVGAIVVEISSRKRAEQALQEREAFLRAIGDNLPKGFLYQIVRGLDGSARFSYLSAGVERELGVKVEELLLNQSLFDGLILEADRREREQKVAESFQNLSIFDVQVRMRPQCGEIRWVRLCSTPRRLENGCTVWDGIYLDITDLKQTEDQLRHHQALLAEAQQVARIGNWDYHLATQKITWTPELFHILNYDPALGEPNQEQEILLYHPEDREKLQRATQRTITTGEPYKLTLRVPQADGSISYIEAIGRAGFNREGTLVRLYGTVQDITERQQTEASLEEFNRRWRSLLDNVQLIVVGLDRQGNVDYINPFFQTLTQFTPAEVLGKNWFLNFLPSSCGSFIFSSFQQTVSQGSLMPTYYQNPILTKSGEERLIAWNNTILRDPSGEIIGTISIGEDITERQHLERMKAEFVSVVSHELRTPLTSMQAALSLLHEKIIDPSSAEGELTIQIATEGVDRLVRLVNDILDLERLESGKIHIEKRPCDTGDLVATAIAQMQEMANQTNVILDTNSASFSIDADPDRFLQVLTNLLSNAIKFSASGSTIWISVEEQSFEVSGENQLQPFLVFSVKDQGRGIPADSLERIFERFQQVDASDSREKNGTGLGLTICRNIVEQHGGTIWAQSIVGQGSTFYFRLPISGGEKL